MSCEATEIDSNEDDEEIEVVGYVKFSEQVTQSLSGVSIRPASDSKTDFYEVSHRLESGVYMCDWFCNHSWLIGVVLFHFLVMRFMVWLCL